MSAVTDFGFVLKPTTRNDLVLAVFEDEHHIIEGDIAQYEESSTLTLRFALCLPATVDAVFEGIVAALHSRLGGNVVVESDPESAPGHYGVASEDELRYALRRGIVQRRTEWQSAFGTTTAKVSSHEALRLFVIEQAES